jgi:hypothetical protein
VQAVCRVGDDDTGEACCHTYTAALSAVDDAGPLTCMLDETSCRTFASSVASSRFLLRLLREIRHICDMLLRVLLFETPATIQHRSALAG